MIVQIWGPKADNAWRESAQRAAREHFPGYALQVRHPDEFKPLTSEEVAKIAGVLVTVGCDLVFQGLKKAGVRDHLIRVVPLEPDSPDPNRTGSEDQAGSRTGTYLADPNDEEGRRAEEGAGGEDEVDDPGPDDPGKEVQPEVATPDAAAPSTDPADPQVVARFVERDAEAIRELLLDPDMLEVFNKAFMEKALAAEHEALNPRHEVLEMLSKRAGVPYTSPTAAEEAQVPTDAPAETVPGEPTSMTPAEFSRKGVRNIRALLKDPPEGLLTGAFIQEVLDLESEKAKPRADVMRKLKARLAEAG